MILSDEAFVLTGLDEAEEVASFRLRYGLGNKVKATCEDLSEVRRLIQVGIGVGFLPTLNSTATENQKSLWPLLDETVDLPSYNLWVVSAKPHKRSPGAERFVATVDRILNNKLKNLARLPE
jgi:DNA-binding transcriptional LysR family regulator